MMAWAAGICSLIILMWPVSFVHAFRKGYAEGLQDNEKQHAHERDLRRQSMSDRTVTSSSLDSEVHARVHTARIRSRRTPQ